MDDFQCLIWIFWVCLFKKSFIARYLLYNIVLLSTIHYHEPAISIHSAISHVVQCWLFSIKVLIWWLSTGIPGRGASFSKKSLAQKFANHFWHIRLVTAPSSCTAQIFTLHFSSAFTFLEIIKPNRLKMLLFSFYLHY